MVLAAFILVLLLIPAQGAALWLIFTERKKLHKRLNVQRRALLQHKMLFEQYVSTNQGLKQEFVQPNESAKPKPVPPRTGTQAKREAEARLAQA